MREKPVITDSEIACEREFVFDNEDGGWTINGQLFNFLPRFEVKQGTAERWTIAQRVARLGAPDPHPPRGASVRDDGTARRRRTSSKCAKTWLCCVREIRSP